MKAMIVILTNDDGRSGKLMSMTPSKRCPSGGFWPKRPGPLVGGAPGRMGVRAVIAESFERIHRSNLVGMGILPLVFETGADRKSLGLTGAETIDIIGLDNLERRMQLLLVVHRPDLRVDRVSVICRIDTAEEVTYYRHGGILPYVLRGMAAAHSHAS